METAVEVRQSDIQIDSISIEITSGGIPRDIAEKCKHFSIRGFVSKVRKNNSKICSPFISDGGTNNACEKIYELQDMVVPTYRWWQCDGCHQGYVSSKETTSVDVITPYSFPRTSADKCNNNLSSPSSSKKLSTVKEQQSSQFMLKEIKNMPSYSRHTKDSVLIEKSAEAQYSGRDVRLYTKSSSPVQLLQEGYSSEQADRKNASPLKLPTEHLSGEFASTFQEKSKALTAPQCTGASSRKCIFNDLQSAQDNFLVESDSSQRAPMPPPSDWNSLSSQNTGYLQGTLKDVPFAPSTSLRSSKSISSQEPIQRSACGTSRGETVMGPPRSFPDKRPSAQKILSKENELQAGRSPNAKRVVQPQNHVEGHGIILKDNSDREVQQPTVAAVRVDPLTQRSHNEESVAPKPKRTRELSSKRKGAINVSSDEKTHLNEQGDYKVNLNLLGNEDSSSSGQCSKGKVEISVEVSKAMEATHITPAHSAPPREFPDSGSSASGHVHDYDEDEDYQDKNMEEGRHLRLRRTRKIFSLRKVMDKVNHQNIEPSKTGNSRKRNRKYRSKDEESIVLRSNNSQIGGYKSVTTHNFHRENSKKNCQISGSAVEEVSPAEKDCSLQMKKCAPDNPEPANKSKRMRTEKRDLSFMNSQEKPEPKDNHEKRPHRRIISEEKPEWSNRTYRKRKKALLETKEKSSAASKGVETEDDEVEIKKMKDSSPDSILATCRNKETLIDENITDATTSPPIQGDGGGKEATEKAKEKLVSEDEARGITLLSFVATGEGPASPPKSGRMKDFDINVPAEEISMDIVELMAKNQLERTSDAVSDKHIITHDLSTTQTRNSALIETTTAFSAGVSRVQNPYPIAMKPPLVSDPRNGFYHTGPEHLLEVQKSSSQVGCPGQVRGWVPYSSVVSTEPSWRPNNTAVKPFSTQITQVVGSCTEYRGGIPSLPFNSSTYSPLNLLGKGQTPIEERGNQKLFSSSSDQLVWPPINHRSRPLELFPEETQNNGFGLLQSSRQRTVSDHPYAKKMGVHSLPSKAEESVVLSSKEAIPTPQLLNFMHSTGSPNQTSAGDVNGNRTVDYLNKALFEPEHFQYNKMYRDAPQFEPCKNISAGSRIPIYDSKGRSISVQNPCRHTPHASAQQFAHSLFHNNSIAVEKFGGKFVNFLNFSSQDQRERVRNFVWPSQSLTLKPETPLHASYEVRLCETPLHSSYNRDREYQREKVAAAAPSWWSMKALQSSTNRRISGSGNHLVARADHQLPIPNTEVCMVNKNPSDITDPRESSKFTIQPEELRRSSSNFIMQPEEFRRSINNSIIQSKELRNSIHNRLQTMSRGIGCESKSEL